MSLFGALSELAGGAILASAPACDLALPDDCVRERAHFIGWLAQRDEMRELRAVVETIGREIWIGSETKGLAQRDLDFHLRAAALILAEHRPAAGLLAEVAAASRSATPAAASEPISRRIAMDIVNRARIARAFLDPLPGLTDGVLLREDVVYFLLERTFAHLTGEGLRLMRFGAALADFASELQPERGQSTNSQASGLDSLGISRAFVQQLDLVGGAAFLADLGERFGLGERAVRRLVALIDGQALGAESRIAKLESLAQWLGDVRAQLLKPANDEAELRRLKAAAAAALAEGDFETAMDGLRNVRRELREVRRRTEERLQDEAVALRGQMLDEARATARLAELMQARGEHLQAADLFAEAATSLPRADKDAAAKLNLQRANALLRHARERNDATVLSDALNSFTALVRSAAEGSNSKLLGDACLGHGDALLALGERDPGNGRLKDAIAIYQKAIQLFERERDEASLRLARIAIARAFAKQGEVDGSIDTLMQAAQAYRDAAGIVPSDLMASEHADIQLGLGGVLLAIEERQGGLALLKEAATAYDTAIGLIDAENETDRWGEAQMNLGLALLGIGEQEGSQAQLEASVVAFRAALDVTPRVIAPRRWALTQMNLGNALAALGDRDLNDTAQLDAAVAAYHLALEELLREAEPLKWAIAQMNLGTALIRLGERGDRRKHWLAAASAMVPALEVFEQVGADSLADMTRANLKRFQDSWDSFLAPPGAQHAKGEAQKPVLPRPRLAKTA
jgi:tetratricopeptide (TPR) repeat protein